MAFAVHPTMRRYRDGLQAMPWLSLVGYGLLIWVYGAIASLLLPTAWHRPFMRHLLLAPLLLLVAKDLACIPVRMRRWQVASARGASWPARLWALAPPELFAYLRLDRALWRGFFAWIARRPPPVRPAGIPLG